MKMEFNLLFLKLLVILIIINKKIIIIIIVIIFIISITSRWVNYSSSRISFKNNHSFLVLISVML